ncbi:MAG TPA: NAD-dependent epimerase/dehydratase family protein [Burkholderiales bacterium]|nr:NAD-dependent epimerase/dehydratase family protein [Burkholderiales bacterium]
MHILVTGGAGFIGSHLVERLVREGRRVRVLDNLSSGKRANLAGVSGVEFIEGDIRDASTVRTGMNGIDAIYHLAAVASVQASIDDPLGTHGSNFTGTLNLLEAARRQGVRRMIYASSAAVYGDTNDLPVSEKTLTHPLSPYAADKLAGEHYLNFYAAKHGIATTAFRFFNIYGPRQDASSPYSGVISIFVERVQRGQGVVVFGDGRQTRDFVFVRDLVDVLTGTLSSEKTFGAVLNVGRGVECSLLDLLGTLERLVGRSVPRQHEPARVGDILRSRADVSRLEAMLNYVPSTAMEVGLAELLSSQTTRAK